MQDRIIAPLTAARREQDAAISAASLPFPDITTTYDEKSSITVPKIELMEQEASIKALRHALITEKRKHAETIKDYNDILPIAKESAISQKKTSWGWYALAITGVLIGAALTATGIGAIIGTPLAVAFLSGMIATSLPTSALCIMVGIGSAVLGFCSIIKSCINIHRYRTFDKVHDGIIEENIITVNRYKLIREMPLDPALFNDSSRSLVNRFGSFKASQSTMTTTAIINRTPTNSNPTLFGNQDSSLQQPAVSSTSVTSTSTNKPKK